MAAGWSFYRRRLTPTSGLFEESSRALREDFLGEDFDADLYFHVLALEAFHDVNLGIRTKRFTIAGHTCFTSLSPQVAVNIRFKKFASRLEVFQIALASARAPEDGLIMAVAMEAVRRRLMAFRQIALAGLGEEGCFLEILARDLRGLEDLEDMLQHNPLPFIRRHHCFSPCFRVP